MQQALEVIKGADRVVTQHLVELLRNGVPLQAGTMGESERGVRASRLEPSCPQQDTLSCGKFLQGSSATD